MEKTQVSRLRRSRMISSSYVLRRQALNIQPYYSTVLGLGCVLDTLTPQIALLIYLVFTYLWAGYVPIRSEVILTSYFQLNAATRTPERAWWTREKCMKLIRDR